MGITYDRGRWYVVVRRPKRYAHVDPRSQFRAALHTDSRVEAAAKAPAVEAQIRARWEGLAAGEGDDAEARWRAARALAAARGFSWRAAADLAAPAALPELVARTAPLASPEGVAPRA